jgi:sulfoxide reductase heme-binding subunit YedZ
MQDVETTWLLARSSGMLAYLLLTLGVVAGLTLSTRMFGRAIPPAVITGVHRTLSTLGLGALALHVGMLVLDTKVDIPLVSLVVPGLTEYRPIATGLGVVALELWVLIQLSFPLRRHIGVRTWRRMHYATFGLWALAAMHGIAAGTDSGTPWARWLYVVSISLVVGLLGWRIVAARFPEPRTRTPRPAPAGKAPSSVTAGNTSHAAATRVHTNHQSMEVTHV